MHIRLIFLAFIFTISVAGCGGKSIKGKTYGVITINKPLLQTRESLVNDRAEQLEWLTVVLPKDKYINHGIQGQLLTKSFTSFGASLDLQLDPTVLKNYKASQENTLSGLKRSEDLAEKSHQYDIDAIRRENELAESAAEANAALNSLKVEQANSQVQLYKICAGALGGRINDIEPETGEGEGEEGKKPAFEFTSDELKALCGDSLGLSDGIQGSLTEKNVNSLTKKIADLETKLAQKSSSDLTGSGVVTPGTSGSLLEQTKTTLEGFEKAIKSPSVPDVENLNALKNIANVSPIDEFEDQLAFRDRVRSEIQKVKLDYTHDEQGNTLYQLQFDATVLPELDTSAWARIEMEIDNGSQFCKNSNSSDAQLFNKWVDDLNEHLSMDLKATITRMFSRSQLEELSNSRELRILKAGTGAYDESLACGAKKSIPIVRGSDVERKELNTNDVKKKLTAAKAVIHEYLTEGKLGRYVHPTFTVTGSGPWVDLVVEPCPGVEEKWLDTLSSNEAISTVYSVTPKESTQRISEIASYQDFKNLGLSANFLAGTAVGGKAAIEYIKGKEALMHAINRKPLVVSYADSRFTNSGQSDTKFGWVIGPVYGIDKATVFNKTPSAYFRHVANTETLTVIVSVPAWWKSLNIDVNTDWMDEDKISSQYNNKGNNNFSFCRNLPGDVRNITPVLVGRELRNPVAKILRTKKNTVISTNTKFHIRLNGRNLWREPIVLIGDVASTSVKILPGMKDIIASFDPTSMKDFGCGSTSTKCFVEIEVLTPDGKASAGEVLIVEAQKVEDKDKDKDKGKGKDTGQDKLVPETREAHTDEHKNKGTKSEKSVAQ